MTGAIVDFPHSRISEFRRTQAAVAREFEIDLATAALPERIPLAREEGDIEATAKRDCVEVFIRHAGGGAIVWVKPADARHLARALNAAAAEVGRASGDGKPRPDHEVG